METPWNHDTPRWRRWRQPLSFICIRVRACAICLCAVPFFKCHQRSQSNTSKWSLPSSPTFLLHAPATVKSNSSASSHWCFCFRTHTCKCPVHNLCSPPSSGPVCRSLKWMLSVSLLCRNQRRATLCGWWNHYFLLKSCKLNALLQRKKKKHTRMQFAARIWENI